MSKAGFLFAAENRLGIICSRSRHLAAGWRTPGTYAGVDRIVVIATNHVGGVVPNEIDHLARV